MSGPSFRPARPPAAVPHPQVADDKLYRSTDASDPIAKRLRSIISWAAQRTRDRLFRSVREDEMSVAQSAAKGVIDAFIEDVCSLRVDTSVSYQVRGALTSGFGSRQDQIVTDSPLPPGLKLVLPEIYTGAEPVS